MTLIWAPPTTVPGAEPTPSTVPELTPEQAEKLYSDPRPIGRRTLDDVASLIGSAIGSLGLVWLVYERLLDWTGILGFLVCWFVVYLALYAFVSALSNPRPVVVERLVAAIITGGAAVVGFALLATVVFIIGKGWPAMRHLNFYTQSLTGVRPTEPLTHGGVLNAVVGSGIEIAIAVVIALPLGIGTSLYLTEVGGRFARVVRTVVEAMTALPDILAGLFIYTVLIIGLHWNRTGLAAALALAVTMTPIIARSAEVALRVVPGGLREAGLALPTAKAGLATSLILGIARIAGETAPLLIVSGASTFFNANPLSEPMNSMPLFIYSAVRSGEPNFIARGYGAAALLLILVVGLFVVTRFIARDKSSR
jgi:phosphate transport system permease protein